MYCISSGTTDPFLNLAIEEILLKNRKDEYIILGINKASVITGKHQVAHREADTRFIALNNIPLIRRISGGGTVFHDRGNVNFTFISRSEAGKQVDFPRHTRPVIGFLASLGVEAKFEGKNDIKTGGLKISGNAEHVYRNRVLHHGTLLFDSDLVALKSSLRKDQSSYESRGVMSNPSPVRNLKGLIPLTNSSEELLKMMKQYFLDSFAGAEEYELTGNELGQAGELAASKYRTWEWNYAYGPEYEFRKEFIFNKDNISVRFYVKEGIIRDCILEGNNKLREISGKMTGMRHMPEDLQELVGDDTDVPDVFSFF